MKEKVILYIQAPLISELEVDESWKDWLFVSENLIFAMHTDNVYAK